MTKRILHIGIASPKYIHRRMIEIAKGRAKSTNELRIWFNIIPGARPGVF